MIYYGLQLMSTGLNLFIFYINELVFALPFDTLALT